MPVTDRALADLLAENARLQVALKDARDTIERLMRSLAAKLPEERG